MSGEQHRYPSLRITSFGNFTIDYLATPPTTADHEPGYNRVPEQVWRGRKQAQTALKVLLCRPQRRAPRDVLQEALWPQGKGDAADGAFNTIMSVLRHVLSLPATEQPLLTVTRVDEQTIYQLAPQAAIWLDADEAESLLLQAEQAVRDRQDPLSLLEQIYAIFSKGPFLADDDGEWVQQRKWHLDELAHRCTHWLIDLYEERNLLRQAITVLSSLCEADPTDEDILARLMHLLARQGRRNEALRCYQRAERAMQAEEMALTPAIQQFAERIRNEVPLFGMKTSSLTETIQTLESDEFVNRREATKTIESDSEVVQSHYQYQQHIWIPPETNGVNRLRRKLLQQFFHAAGLSIFASQELLHEDSWERLLRILDKPYSLDETALAHLEQLTNFHWELYRSALAKVDLLSSLSGHLQTVTRLLEHGHPVPVQRRLCSIVSNTTQIIGEVYFDMNQCLKATTYYDLAIDAAQEADNHRLYSLALGRKGFLPIYLGYSQESLFPLQYAYSLAKQTTTGKSKSWLITMQAEAFSSLKNKRECLSSLEEAERVIEVAEDGEDAHWTGFSRDTLAGYKGTCYMRLEMSEEARKVLEQSLNSLPPGSTRRKSIGLSDLATTFVQEGEIEEACRIATESLLVATQSKSARAIQRLRELQHRLQPWKNHTSVKRLNDQLAAFTTV